MEYFHTDKPGRVFVLRLDRGDLLLESIQALVDREGIRDGVVLSGIGTLDRSVIHMVTTAGYPPQEHFRTDDAPLELAALQGAIADGSPHLHMVVSDKDRAYAGHLEPGCRVLYLAEVVIQEFHGLGLQRVRDDGNISKLRRARTGMPSHDANPEKDR
jgi:predicted DNA-binding protein with PD1-like motif